MKAVTEEASECLENAFTDVLSHVFVISNNTDSSQKERGKNYADNQRERDQ